MNTHESEKVLRQRLQDAEFLWAAGRRESAFTLLLVALAASSRRRRPPPAGDGVAFRGLLNDYLKTDGILVLYRGTDRSLSWLLYKLLRCELIHEGIMIGIKFLPEEALLKRPTASMDENYLDPAPSSFMPPSPFEGRRKLDSFNRMSQAMGDTKVKMLGEENGALLGVSPNLFWILVGIVETEIIHGGPAAVPKYLNPRRPD